VIVFDGIVYSLQQMGGISVMFAEIIARLPHGSYDLVGFREAPPPFLATARWRYEPPRLMERYRRARFGGAGDVFHSTYFRLPADRRAKVVTTVYDFNYERHGTFPTRQIHTTQKRIAVDRTNHAFAYVFAGSGTFRDASDPQGVLTEQTDGGIARSPVDGAAGNRSLVLFDRGDEVVVQAGDDGIRFLLVSGRPIEEPVAWYGPIVMNTKDQLQQAFNELRNGTFITR